jgi:hypothetical protein
MHQRSCGIFRFPSWTALRSAAARGNRPTSEGDIAVQKKTTGMVLAAAAAVVALTFAPSASADQLSPPGTWVKSQDYQSRYLCRSAGLAGEFFGLWQEGDWKCEGSTLFVRQLASVPGIG